MTNTVYSIQPVKHLFSLLIFICIATTNLLGQTTNFQFASGRWNDEGNWSNGLPGPGKDAQIFGSSSVVIDEDLTIDFRVDCFGSLTLSAALINEGTISISGSFNVLSTGSLTNRSDFSIFGASTVEAGAVFLNDTDGNFTNGGPLTIETTLENKGFFTNNASFTAALGTILSSGNFQNNQPLNILSLTVSEGSSLTNNSGAPLTISGTEGNFLLNGTVTNIGQIRNEGNTQINGVLNNNVNFTNDGTVAISDNGQVNSPGMFITNGDFTNEGSFTNGFMFQNSGTATNNAQFFNNNQIKNLDGASFINEQDALIQGGFGSLTDNAGDFLNLGNISTPGKILNVGGTFENDGILNLPSGSNLENGSDFFNLGTINSNNVIASGGLFNNFGIVNINAGCTFTNLGFLNNFSPGKIVNLQEFENNPVATFYNESMVVNSVRMFLDGTTINNGSFENTGDIFIRQNGEFTNNEALLQLGGNIANEGSIINTNYLLNDECSSLKNLGTIDNQDVLENRGIFLQRGTFTGNSITNNDGFIQQNSSSDVIPELCQDFTVGATINGQIKVYANSLVAFENFDSCSNIVYLADGINLNIYGCEDIARETIEVEVLIKTRIDELTCNAIVRPVDGLAPVFAGCPANMSVLTENNQVSVSWTPPTATDNCSAATLTSDFSPGDIFPVGPNTVTYTSEDIYGNSNQCQFQINVIKTPPANPCNNDQTPPAVAGCPANQTIASDFLTTPATWTPPVFTDACQPLMIMVSKQPGSSFPVGTTMVVYTGKDGNGNIATCQFNITVTLNDPCAADTQAPTFLSCPQNISLNQNIVIMGAVAIWNVPGAIDNCNLVSIVSNKNPGNIFPVGTTTVTYTATDAKGNQGICSFSVNVGADPCPGDVTPPVFSGCPQNINLTTSTASAIANWTPPTANDPCQPVSLFSNRLPGTAFNVGATNVVYTASDARGNTANCSFVVNVVNPCLSDITPPTISNCPSNITISTGGTHAPASWTSPTATDNCTLASLTASYLPGALFPIGETTVEYIALDARNNKSTCSFVVKVVDNKPPTVLCKNAQVFLNASGAGSITVNNIDAGSNDANGISSLVISPSTFSCSQTGNRTVTLTATDVFNNSASCNATVTVVDAIKPVIQCPGNITACEGETVTYAPPVASDNCSFNVVQTDGTGLKSGNVFPKGTTLQRFAAIDGSANATICSFNVTVLAAPVVSIANVPCTGFCQGVVILTANASGNNTFQWSNGKTTKTITATPGDYQVTVTGSNGCKKVVTTSVAPIDPSTTAAYTILAEEEVKMKENTVVTGGVGVWKSGKTIKLEDNTKVQKFIRSSKNDIDNSSSAGQIFLQTAPNPTSLLTLKTNPNPSSTDLKVKKGETLAIFGNNYGKIEIEEGATAIFHATTDIKVKEFKTKNGKVNEITSVIFLNPVDVIVQNKLEIGDYSSVNEGGPNVTFHLEDNAEIKKSVIFHANIYAPAKDLKIDDANLDYHTEMVGLFIAKKVDSKKYVDWYQRTQQSPGPQLQGIAEQLVFNAYQEPQGVRIMLNWVTNTEYKNESFEVEKSLDGIHFEPVLLVSSKGQDDRPESYKNVDAAPSEGSNFYRLKLNYNDGTFSYSPVQQVWINLDPASFQLFPNPASEVISFYRSKYVGKAAVVKVINSFGLTIREIKIDALPSEPVQVDLNELKSGLYFLSVKVEGHREMNRQFVVAKD